MAVKEVVIAGTYWQYKTYLRETDKSEAECKFVWYLEDILGLHNVAVVYTGEFWRNPLYHGARLRMLEGRAQQDFAEMERFSDARIERKDDGPKSN